jgi:hypothetical protein
MRFLFDSLGRHIANEVNGQLHAPHGQNVGHPLPGGGADVFIDMTGHYLGEVVSKDRLMRRTYNPYSGVNFGSFGNCGSVGNFGTPGSPGKVSWLAIQM